MGCSHENLLPCIIMEESTRIFDIVIYMETNEYKF